MQIITKTGLFVNGGLIHRKEPWKTPQEVDDGLFELLPEDPGVIIVVPPAGWRFKDGVDVDMHPTRKDVEPDVADEDEDEDDKEPAKEPAKEPEKSTGQPTPAEVKAAKERLASAKKG